MRTAFITFVLLLVGTNSFSQIELVDSCEQNFGPLCGSSFRIYSDSTFIRTFGCETRQRIQIGTYNRKKDTTFLHPTRIKFENFIDSIVFVPKTDTSDFLDVFYFGRYGARLSGENDKLTQIDSALVWSKEKSGHGIRNKYEGIYMYSRQHDYFSEHSESIPKNHPYYNSLAFIVKSDVELGLILRNFFLWTGINHVVSVPNNTREVRVYYAHSAEVLIPLWQYGGKLKHNIQKLEPFDCHGITYIFEE